MPEQPTTTTDHDVDAGDRVCVLPVVLIVMTPEDYAAMLAEPALTDIDEGGVC